MLLARGHSERHEALVFEEGVCFLCGRELEPEVGEGYRLDNVDKLLTKIFETRNRMEAEAESRGLTWSEYCDDWAARQ